MNNILKTLIILSVVGLLVSIYLTIKTYDPSSVACSIGGGCETVLSSEYAKLFNVPISVYGILWYLVQLGTLFFIGVKKLDLYKQLKIWTVIGLLFSLPLLYIEAYIIHAYCTWCLVSLGLVVASTVLVFLPNKMKGLKK